MLLGLGLLAAGVLAPAPAHAATATYSDLTWSTTPTKWKFQKRTVRSVLPRNPVGIVWIFHGTNGSSDVVDLPEMQFVLQVLLDRGYGFVAVDAAGRQFDTVSAAGSNKDWQYVNNLRKKLLADGSFTAKTPTYALGFSAGGAFTSWVGHVAPGAGWPLKALVLHNSAGWTKSYRSQPDLPMAFLPSENDVVVDPDDVYAVYRKQVSRGLDAYYGLNLEEDLVPTRFDRSPYLDAADSRRLFDAFVAHGWYDASGRRLYRDPNALVDDVLARYPDITPIKPTKAVMSAVLATHAVNAGHAYEEADFLDAHR